MPPGARDLLERFAVVSTAKLPAAQRATSEFWPAHESEIVGPDPYALILNRALLGDLAITYVRCSARIRVRLLEPCRHPCLIVPLAGSVEISGDSGTYQAIPGQPLLRAAGWLRRFEAAPCRCLLLDVTTAALERSSKSAGRENVASLGHVSFAGEVADLLHSRVLSFARAVNTSTRAVALQGLSEADRLRLLSTGIRGREASLLRTLATALAAEPRSEQLADSADVEAWLRQHAMNRMPLAEIARRAGRSMRSIQRACCKLGYTPQAFLRAVRLDRARELLLDPAGGLTIADVAETVGYPHEGRFAGYYYEGFGELPSATLARSHRSPPPIRPAEKSSG
jgi:AraC-like DNA-binding protein